MASPARLPLRRRLVRLVRLVRDRALALALAVTVAGCATPAPPAGVPAPGESTLRQWFGRFAVALHQHGAELRPETGSGRFELVERGRALELTLYSPFGQTFAVAQRRADGTARLALSDGRSLQAPSLDALVERALGYALPVERLPSWLETRFERVLQRDYSGRPVAAVDSGWQIRLDHRRWEMQREHDSGTLTVTLLLDH